MSYENALRSHQHCIACGSAEVNAVTLGLIFQSVTEQCVTAEFQVTADHQGYNGLLHGGIASTLVDAAMTHCLLARGIHGLTAELNVRFHAPIKLGDRIHIEGEMVRQRHKIYLLEARLRVNGVIAVSANGKFIEPHHTVIALTVPDNQIR